MYRLLPILIVILAAACTLTNETVPEPDTSDDLRSEIFWPPPPGRERIRYLYSFSGPADRGYRLPLATRFKDILAGGSFSGMVRPYAVASNSRITLVADPGLSAVHMFNHKKRLFQVVRTINGTDLSSPVGVALGDDHLFIADSALKRVFILDDKLRLIHQLDTFARPTGLAYDSKRRHLFVADTRAHQVVEVDEKGNTVRVFGGRGREGGQFNFPTHLAVYEDTLFVNDTMNFRVQLFSLVSGNHLTSFGEHGDSPGYFEQPKGLAISSDGRLFVAESLFGRIQIFSMEGDFLLDFGRDGSSPGQFRLPAGMAIFNDLLYVADSFNGRVQVFQYHAEP